MGFHCTKWSCFLLSDTIDQEFWVFSLAFTSLNKFQLLSTVTGAYKMGLWVFKVSFDYLVNLGRHGRRLDFLLDGRYEQFSEKFIFWNDGQNYLIYIPWWDETRAIGDEIRLLPYFLSRVNATQEAAVSVGPSNNYIQYVIILLFCNVAMLICYCRGWYMTIVLCNNVIGWLLLYNSVIFYLYIYVYMNSSYVMSLCNCVTYVIIVNYITTLEKR